MMEQRDLFIKCCFSEEQLNAMRELYFKYFHPHMPETYDGLAIVGLWGKRSTWNSTKGFDYDHNNRGIIVPEAQDDPLWEKFQPLLPYMGKHAVITKMSGDSVMNPHIDRLWRPHAIYFPIAGCSEDCYSEYYDLPKQDVMKRQVRGIFPEPVYTYKIIDNAYLTNVHEWHGVRNTANHERIAFGWNFERQWPYTKCRDLLLDLGLAIE